ncbi:MAG TPA: diaminopimelate dehydrogenase [Paenibacillaceae bacterium]
MSDKIQIGIVGYGNIGRGVAAAIERAPDMELAAVFTRRNPAELSGTDGIVFRHVSEADEYRDRIDVMILCGGSATDLPEQGPQFASRFNTVDSYDTHARIPEYYERMDAAAKAAGRVAVISTGWDPGLFSLNRMIMEAVLPDGKEYTFWGKGVSQGHSDAIRRVEGVKNAVQYTIPVEEAIARIRAGETPELAARDKHIRECFVVPHEGADLAKIERDIVTMPHYFADYHTIVHFIDEEELRAKHSAMPHGGFVIRSGVTGQGTKQLMEFTLKLGSNPEFTASVLVAYARAAYRLHKEGVTGAKTVFDIAPAYLSLRSPEELRRDLL